MTAVLFDRDDTLIVDVPYLGDPGLVRPMPGVTDALHRLRAAGIPLGVVSNQSGVAKGLITEEQLQAVNAELRRQLGPFQSWQVCPHDEHAGCACRKPLPGMVYAAAAELSVDPVRCFVIGDIETDIAAAAAAGATGILVPTERTKPDEVARARHKHALAHSLAEAVNRVLTATGAPNV